MRNLNSPCMPPSYSEDFRDFHILQILKLNEYYCGRKAVTFRVETHYQMQQAARKDRAVLTSQTGGSQAGGQWCVEQLARYVPRMPD